MPTYPLAPDDIVEHRLLMNLFGQKVMFTEHYIIGTGTPATADLGEFQGAWLDERWTDNLQTVLSQDVTDVVSEAQTISPVRKVVNDVAPALTTGALADEACPPTTAVVLRKRTILAGPAHRGRIFVPGIPYTSTFQGQVSAAVRDDWQVMANGLTNDIEFSGRVARAIIWSVQTGVNRGAITQGVLDTVLRVQRRREIGKGQ